VLLSNCFTLRNHFSFLLRMLHVLPNLISTSLVRNTGPGSVVHVATCYGLDGPGIESRWGRDFPHLSRPPLGPTQPPVKYVPGLFRGKERPGRDADPSPHLVPWSWKGRAIPLLPLLAVWPVQSLSACTTVHFTVRPVQSLGACTRVHFTVLLVPNNLRTVKSRKVILKHFFSLS
jgi:hypothetical protein